MFYQGETIKINIKSDSVNLQDNDFVLSVYHSFELDKSITKTKADADSTSDDGKYCFTLDYDETKVLPIGKYTIEILIEEDGGNFRSIFKQKDAFTLEYSFFKTL